MGGESSPSIPPILCFFLSAMLLICSCLHETEIFFIVILCLPRHLPFMFQDPRILRGQTGIETSQSMLLDDKTHSHVYTHFPARITGIDAAPLCCHPFACGGSWGMPSSSHGWTRWASHQGCSPSIALPRLEGLPWVSQPIHPPTAGADAVLTLTLSPLTCSIYMHACHGSSASAETARGLSLAAVSWCGLCAGRAGGVWASAPSGANFSRCPVSLPLRAVQHSLLEAPQDTAHSSHLPIPAPFPDLLLSPSLQLHPGPWDCRLRKVLRRNLFQAPAPGSQPKPLVPRTHGTQVLPRILIQLWHSECWECTVWWLPVCRGQGIRRGSFPMSPVLLALPLPSPGMQRASPGRGSLFCSGPGLVTCDSHWPLYLSPGPVTCLPFRPRGHPVKKAGGSCPITILNPGGQAFSAGQGLGWAWR